MIYKDATAAGEVIETSTTFEQLGGWPEVAVQREVGTAAKAFAGVGRLQDSAVKVSAMRVYFSHANAVGTLMVTDDAAPVDRDFVIAIALKQLPRVRSFGSDPTIKGK